MTRPVRVLAALSGGVDSAVAAARAVEAGYDVVGVHMALTVGGETGRGCSTPQDVEDARRIADRLGIPFEVWDLAADFEERVIADFLSEYSAGRTPNPCVRCNERIKFAELLERGRAAGFDAVCTGHYARIVRSGEAARRPGAVHADEPEAMGALGGPAGASTPGAERESAEAIDTGDTCPPATPMVELHRGAFDAKDQSYVLAAVGLEGLGRAIFPLGDAPSKEAVRAEAAARGFAVSDKRDSFDICFIPDGDTRGFLRERLGTEPGSVVDVDGTELARHEGVYGFTIGQRKGLGLGRPAPDGAPRYVLDIRPGTREVVVGPVAALDARSLTGTDVVWIAPDVPAREWTDAAVQVRAHGRAHPARVRVSRLDVSADAAVSARNARGATVVGGAGDASQPDGGAVVLEAEFTGTLPRGIAPGQSAVVYLGTRVLGQATVARVERADGTARA